MIIGNKILKKAQDYINKCNAFRAVKISKQEEPYIIQFFRGLERLGILDYVEGISCRANQNTGTSSNLISLNGKNNGIAVNGPLWSELGIITDSSSGNQITFENSISLPNNEFSIFCICKHSNVSGLGYNHFNGVTNLGGWFPYADGNIYFDATITSGRLITAANITNNAWNSWIATAGSNKKLYKNGILYATENTSSDAGGGVYDTFHFGLMSAGNGYSTTAFFLYSTKDISSVAPQLHQLYFNTIGKTLLTFDPDAAAYISATGISSSTEQQNINDFITGLKGLGVWDDLLDGWTLRSAQNYGTGTSVRGLKGIHNATLVGGPSWSSDGITFNNNMYGDISSLISASNQSHTFAAIINTSINGSIVAMGNNGDPTGTSNGVGFYLSNFGNGQGGFPMFGGIAYGNEVDTTSAPEFDYYTFDSTPGARVGRGYRDTNLTNIGYVANASFFNNTDYVRLGGGSNNYSLRGEMSAAFMWKKMIDPALMVQIRALYKLTIGQGIALT